MSNSCHFLYFFIFAHLNIFTESFCYGCGIMSVSAGKGPVCFYAFYLTKKIQTVPLWLAPVGTSTSLSTLHDMASLFLVASFPIFRMSEQPSQVAISMARRPNSIIPCKGHEHTAD